jgi:hypothetical protein
MVDIPDSDLDPLHERAAVSVKFPVSFVVLDDVESMQLGLAMRAGLDLVRPCLYSVSSLGVGKQTDISDNLAYLGKLNCAVNRYLGVGVVNVATFYKDATVRQLITQSVYERPLAFADVASFSRAVAEFRIRPASEPIEFVGLNPPADSDVMEVGRPGPGVRLFAVMTAAFSAVQMYLSPWM